MLQILLVDDEPYVVDDLSITIPWADLQFEQVHKAYSGQEALEILMHNPIDIVITDISMPEMSGLQLIEEIRSGWKHIKCVLLTGYAEFEYAKKAIENQASAYLLKPIGDEQLIEVLQQLHLEIQREWETLSSFQNTMQTFREHLPLLRDRLLNETLQGRRFTKEQLSEHMHKYQLSPMIDEHVAIMIVRLEDYFQRQDMNSIPLFEYAIVNIANELFHEQFDIWSCKDVHEYLVFLLKPKSPDVRSFSLTQTAFELQKNVSMYLKGDVSVATTSWGIFPYKVRELYQSAVALIRQRIGHDTGLFLTVDQQIGNQDIQIMQSLYEPPTFLHLFEANRWDAIEEKLHAVFHELKGSGEHSQEHIEVTRNYLKTAFYYFAHKNNKLLRDILAPSMNESRKFHSPEMLKDWAMELIVQLRAYFDSGHQEQRSILINDVHDFVDSNIGYVSLQSIADHVQLHPVYLSKIYKSETGKSISDYFFQVKMEKAAHLLTNSQLKIYEISTMLGYSTAHYFIKLFKEYSHMTPQEFRERSN
ncbi:response regulator [Paenibacillus sp. HWE-109]|uniref:response regulator n=1 Tax=Paenibacillus sp. HWE-109 TaxID=1306526 RepID=UPI001EDF96F5|nr:response regulator [Paenibacillus sp. HWE-109]UKS28212.1 response regulator [Paenibacillus sp. HWE-109]